MPVIGWSPVVVEIVPSCRVARRVVRDLEYVPRGGRICIVARERDVGMMGVCGVDSNAAHEMSRRRDCVDAEERDA